MLKQKFVFAASLVAMLTVGIGTARADIASTVYVQQGVDSAKTAASAAQTSANNANTAASNAQDSADAAQAAAEAAQASADAAAASAKTANDTVATKQDKSTAVTHTANKVAGNSTVPVYVDSSGVATAITSYSGNAATATKATQDASGNVITSTYATKEELAKKQNTLTIDTSLSSSSTNPVQNKVVNSALSAKEATSNKLKSTDTTTTVTDSNKDTLYPTVGRVQGMIEALDVTDSAVSGQYVSAVSETDGKISVTRASLPTVNNATLTIQKNGTTVDTFTANASSAKTINITVPTGALASKSTVTSSDITDGTIATVDIADSAVTTVKIADANVTLDKMAADSVNSSKIVDGSIMNADIADTAAIDQSKISGLSSALTTIMADIDSQGEALETLAGNVEDNYATKSELSTELAKKQNTLTIDTALSSSSTNPVQNKVVNSALGGKEATSNKLKSTDTTTILDNNKDTLYPTVGRVQGMIGALDVTDSAVSGQYVSAVSETDGKISVTRASLPAVNNATLTIKNGATNTSLATFTANSSTAATATIPAATASVAGLAMLGVIPAGADKSGTATIWVE